MKILLLPILLASAALAQAAPVALFDGKTFDGWDGDTAKTWRIEDGALVGGSLAEKVPHNEFLSTKKTYANFDLRLKFKLTGTEGQINGGVQFWSVRGPSEGAGKPIPDYEMIGYQADLGGDTKGGNFYGALYDESRRRKVLAAPEPEIIAKALKLDDWNDYRIRCVGRHIQLWVNGVPTVDYTETDEGIAQKGLIAVQIHGGGKAEARYKDIVIEELPAQP
jgi:hypothetical protein